MLPSGDMTYPLVGGRITGLRWLRALIFNAPEGETAFPCRGTVTFETGILTLTLGSSSCTVDLTGGHGIKQSACDWIQITAEVDTDSPALIGSGTIELEPCCIFWLMTPMVDVVSGEGWNPLPFVPNGDWGWDTSERVLTATLPEEEGTVETVESGLYMVNGLASKSLEIDGSEAVAITAGVDGSELRIGRGRISAQS